MARYEIETASGGKYEVDLADGDNIESVVSEIERSETDRARTPLTPGVPQSNAGAGRGVFGGPTAEEMQRQSGRQHAIAPEDLPTPEDPTYGAFAAPAPTPKPAKPQLAPGVLKADSAFRDKREAIDDAVDRIEMGMDPGKVFDAFGKLGIGRDEIVKRGVELGGKAFAPDKRPVTVRHGALDGTVKNDRPERSEGGDDIGLSALRGVTGGFKAMADALGADNPLSKKIGVVDDYLEGLRSAAAVNDDERVGQIMAEAQDKGVWENVKAAAEAASVAPASLLANAAGSSVPIILSALLPGVRETLIARMSAAVVAGGLTGAGGTKAQIREDVLAGLVEKGMDRTEAEERADAAQAYLGKNTGQIALAAALTAAEGVTGSERIGIGAIRRAMGKTAPELAGIAEKGILHRTLFGGLEEAVPEIAQSGQQQLASNLAQQREGIDTPTMRGVAGQAALGGIAGFGAGAGFGGVAGPVRADNSKEALFARAFEHDVAGLHFKDAGTDGFARAALTPGSVLTDPRAIRPEDTVRPVRAEEMPTTVLPPEVLEAERQRADTVKAQFAAAQAEVDQPATAEALLPTAEPAPVVPTTPAQPPTGARVGVANVAQGSLLARAENSLKQNAESANEGRAGVPPAGAGVSGTQGTPDNSGGVATGGRAAVEPGGNLAGANAAPDAQAQSGGARTGQDAPSLTALASHYDSRRTRLTKEAAVLRQGKATAAADAKELQAERMPVMSAPEPGPENDLANAVTSLFNGQFGGNVIAYADARQNATDGFHDNGTRVTAVNIAHPEMSLPFTVWHEFTHNIQQRAQDGDAAAQAAEKALEQVWGMISPEGKLTYAAKYLFKAEVKRGEKIEAILADPKRLALVRNEMLADFMGKRGTERKFFEKLAKRDPENFGDFAREWIKVLDNLIGKLKGMLSEYRQKGGVKNIDQWIKGVENLEAAKAHAEEAVLKWKGVGPAPNPAEKSGGSIKHSLRTRDELGGFNPFANEKLDKYDEPTDGSGKDKPLTLDELDDAQREAVRDIAGREGLTEREVVEKFAYTDGDDYLTHATEMGNPPLDSSGYPEIDEDMIPVGEARQMTADEAEEMRAELESQGFRVRGLPVGGTTSKPASPDATSFTDVTDAQIADYGIMAERAYPNIKYTKLSTNQAGGLGEAGEVDIGGLAVEVSVTALGESGDPFTFPSGAAKRFSGGASGMPNPNFRAINGTQMSVEQRKEMANTWAAGIDLYRRNFDLLSSVPPDAGRRVLDAWKKIASKPKAFEFGRIDKVSKLDPDERSVGFLSEKVEEIGYDMMYGKTPYTITPKHHGSNVMVTIKDTKRNISEFGEVELQHDGLGKDNPMLVMHAQNFDRGSGLGKVFYQVAFALAEVADIPVYADGILLGVNNYRRTEQQASAAARSGSTRMVQPGMGQRVYGWVDRAKTDEDSDGNYTRLFLAAARNAAEFVPEVQSLSYDLAGNKFAWPDGSDAETFVSGVLSRPGNRMVSLSRSTLARAALTFRALDGTLDIDGISNIESPVLYSVRQGNEEYAIASTDSGDGYSKLGDRKVSYQVRVADTGEIATLTVPARAAMQLLDERAETIRSLISCLKR